ncbi:MAG TPA: hypothetical protein VFK57_05865 [Vicinamibacterales bacterium]|nr:hypothetical protein [Vicinamibacterales bacterium]
MTRTLSTLAILLTISVSAYARGPQSPRASSEDVNSVALLRDVCGKNSAEPVCAALDDLSADEAWLILNYVCDRATWGTTDPCVRFKQSRGGALILNLKSNAWTAEWEQASHPLTFDVTGAPTLRLRPGDARPLKILVEEISPIVYSAAPGVPKEDDLSVIAGLKSFLALAGTGIQGLVQTLTFSAAEGLAPSPPKPATPPTEGIAPLGKKVPPPPPQAPRECTVAPPDVREAAEQVTRRLEQLVEVGSAMRTLEKALDALAGARTAFIHAAQQAEDGKRVTAAQLVAPNLSDLTRAYDSFDAATRALTESTDRLAACQPLLNAYATMLGAPADGRIVRDLAGRVAGVGGCTDAGVSGLRTALRASAALLADPVIADPGVCTAARLKPILETHRDAMKPLVERLFNARQVEEKVWAAIDKAAGARREVLAGADVLTRQVQRARRHTWDNTLIRSLVVTRPNPALAWNKVQSHEIVLTADSPYVKEISLARAAVEKRAYKLESAVGQILGYGIGLIYTPLHESTYTAVARPGTSTKVIAETKRETRAGDLAAFVTYRFMEHRPARRTVQPTADFGVGITSDRPAFFLGLGLEVFRAARLGFGWSPQRVTRLADGQTPNVTEVSSTDDIRTVKRFATRNYYVSVTFALDSLSLFNSK